MSRPCPETPQHSRSRRRRPASARSRSIQVERRRRLRRPRNHAWRSRCHLDLGALADVLTGRCHDRLYTRDYILEPALALDGFGFSDRGLTSATVSAEMGGRTPHCSSPTLGTSISWATSCSRSRALLARRRSKGRRPPARARKARSPSAMPAPRCRCRSRPPRANSASSTWPSPPRARSGEHTDRGGQPALRPR